MMYSVMKTITTYGGLIIFAIAAIGFAYYFLVYIPYVAEMNAYDFALAEYKQELRQCYTDLGLEITLCAEQDIDCEDPIDQGVVAGCADIEQPVEPEHPLGIIGDITEMLSFWD